MASRALLWLATLPSAASGSAHGLTRGLVIRDPCQIADRQLSGGSLPPRARSRRGPASARAAQRPSGARLYNALNNRALSLIGDRWQIRAVLTLWPAVPRTRAGSEPLRTTTSRCVRGGTGLSPVGRARLGVVAFALFLPSSRRGLCPCHRWMSLAWLPGAVTNASAALQSTGVERV